MLNSSSIVATRMLLLAAILFGCVTRKTSESPQPTLDSVLDSSAITTITSSTTEIDDSTIEETHEHFDCVRGQAQPVVKKSIFPNSNFRLNEDNRTGIESLVRNNGDTLEIRNWGCEYFVLTFRFETSRFKGDTTDIAFWLDKAVIMMNEIQSGIDTPLDISGGTLAASALLKENKNYVLGEEIVSRGGSIRSFATFDRIQKLSDNRYAVEISYATGPL